MRLTNTTQWMLAGFMAFSACIVVHGQGGGPTTLPPNPPRVTLPENVRMQTVLHQAEQMATDRIPFALLDVLPDGVLLGEIVPVQFEAVQQELARRSITMRNDGRVHVEIIGPQGGPPVPPALLEAVNTNPHTVWRHRTDAWVPINRLTELAQLLPERYFIERAHPQSPDGGSQGPGVVGSDSFISGGADGSGFTIAVIDSGYQQLNQARNAGTAPPAAQTTQVDLTGDGFDAGPCPAPPASCSNHGTGVTEAAFAHAPGANYILFNSSGITQAALAVDIAIASGADIITHSLSRYNQGWADNSGDACAYANTAANAGLLFFTSAGNRACQHWQGMMNPGPNDWHRFSGTDETIEITLAAGAGGNFHLQWNTAGGTFDYDLYLYVEDDDGELVLEDSSTNAGNTFETFGYTNDTDETQIIHLAVFRFSGGNTEFELFFHSSGCNSCTGCNFQHVVSASSTTSPSNSTHPNVISNAAVDWSQHTSPPGSVGIIQNFSSRGPTNGGAIRPDISGPTNTATTCCGGSFGGTSSATPNNAGATLAFWSAYPQFNADAIRWLMFEQAELWRDWGTSGKDNVYGHGGSILIDFVPNAVWLARSFGNVGNSTTGPFFTMQAAYDAAVNEGHIHIFPGGNYPESFMSSGTKDVRVETVENIAVLGEP